MSATPPGGVGMMILIGCEGYCWALAGDAKQASSTAKYLRCAGAPLIVFLPCIFLVDSLGNDSARLDQRARPVGAARPLDASACMRRVSRAPAGACRSLMGWLNSSTFLPRLFLLVAALRRSARAADDVQQRLPPLVVDYPEGALDRGGKLGGILDPFAVAAGGFADTLEGGKLVQLNESRVVAAHCPSLRIHGARAALDRTPHAVVHDHEQNRQLVQRRGVVYGRGIAEQIGAVAHHRDHGLVGSRQLGAERSARPPPQTRGRARPEVAVG